VDDIDAPLGAATESYRITISNSDTATMTFESTSSGIIISANDLLPISAGSAGALQTGPLQIAVQQIGDHGVSAALNFTAPSPP
jgi:hypothetical protein